VDIPDYTLENCNDLWPEFLNTTWSDNCSEGGNVQSDFGVDDGMSEDGCYQYRLYTFSVTDNCGNTDTETTRVSRYYDMTNPEIVDIADYELEGCNTPWPESLTTTWSDNCAEGGTVPSDSGVDDGMEGDFEYRLYTFTAIDDCENTSTESTRVGRLIGNSLESVNGEKCISENDNFDLFDYLVGDYDPNGEWSVASGEITIIDEHFFNPSTLLDLNGNYTDDQLGDYIFTYKVKGVCENETEVIITLNNFCDLPCSTSISVEKCITENDNFDLFSFLANNYNPNGEWAVTSGEMTIIDGHFFNPSTLLDLNGNYTNDQLSSDDNQYIFTYRVKGVCVTNVIINIGDYCVNNCAFAVVDENISTALSPDGDGINDTFNAGIDQTSAVANCGTVHVQIFNRWGAIIFESHDYKNTWRGTVPSNAIGSSGSITTGTYFYIIRFKSDLDSGKKFETKTGYFYAVTDK